MSENTLIKHCQRGDKNAFETLLNKNYDSIYRIAYRWCGDQHNAQDITQLACIKLANSIKLFEFKSPFSSWLYRLVINCAKDFYKSPNSFNQREESIDDSPMSQPNNTNDQSEQQIYAQQILQHIDTLQDDLKDTLILVFGQGLSHKLASEQLNVKESTVSWRIHEARKLLKQTFNTTNIQTPDQQSDSINSSRGSA